jgi:flagellar biosynthetic protein FlhB
MVQRLSRRSSAAVSWSITKRCTNRALMLVRLADLSLDALLTCVPLVRRSAHGCAALALLPRQLELFGQGAAADPSRLDPLKGLVAPDLVDGLVELVKAVAKASLLGGVAMWVMWSERGELLAMFAQPMPVGLASAGHCSASAFFAIVSAMLLIVAVDVPSSSGSTTTSSR